MGLREVRQARGLRLSDVAWLVERATGRRIGVATLSRLERNLIDSPAETRAAVARGLKIDPAILWSNYQEGAA